MWGTLLSTKRSPAVMSIGLTKHAVFGCLLYTVPAWPTVLLPDRSIHSCLTLCDTHQLAHLWFPISTIALLLMPHISMTALSD